MTDSKKINFQIIPSKIRIIPNDRVAKKIFNLSFEDLKYWIENLKTLGFSEMSNHKKFGEITSPIQLSVDGENFSISEPLDYFDSSVLSVCISEWTAKNQITTPSVIYRGLTGKVGRSDAEPSKDQLAAIFHSIDKLMRLQLHYDASELCEKLKYNNGIPTKMVGTLLPCHYIQAATVNGKDTTVIHFDAKSILSRIARLKNNQFLSYENAEVFKLERKRSASIMPPTPNKEPPRLAQLKMSLWLSVTKSIKIFTELR